MHHDSRASRSGTRLAHVGDLAHVDALPCSQIEEVAFSVVPALRHTTWISHVEAHVGRSYLPKDRSEWTALEDIKT